MKEHSVDQSIPSTGNDGKTRDTKQEDDEKVYPPKKIVLPAMAAIYLAVFLVALVCLHRRTSTIKLTVV